MLKLDVLSAELNLWANETEQQYRATKEMQYRRNATHLRYLAATLNQSSILAGVTSFNTRTGDVTLLSADVVSALGYTPVTQARTLTINGVTQDLSANRSWTISTAIPTLAQVTTAGNSTDKSIIISKSGVPGTQDYKSLYVYDNTGETTSSYQNNYSLHIEQNTLMSSTGGGLRCGILIEQKGIWSKNIGTSSIGIFVKKVQGTVYAGSYTSGLFGNGIQLGSDTPGYGMSSLVTLTPSTASTGNLGEGTILINNLNSVDSIVGITVSQGNYANLSAAIHFIKTAVNREHDILFKSSNDSLLAERMRIKGSTGNVLINTTTDAGYKLDVNGTARVQGILAATGNYVQFGTNANVGIGSTSTGASFINNGLALLYATANINNAINLYGHNFYSGNYNATSGTQGVISLTGPPTFTPTSGTAVFNALNLAFTINQTGGANGITRGLYVNPTITAAADFRAIETTVGNILLVTTSGDVAIGTSTLATATKLTLGGSETAISAIARGQLLNTTLVAAANNDVLVGLDINPTFTNGAFTGVTNYGLRLSNSQGFFGGSGGIAMFIGDNTAIRGDATSSGIMYIDASRNLTGTLNLRATTLNYPGGSSTLSLFNYTGLGATFSSSNMALTVAGAGVPSFRINNTTSASTWYFENNRNAPSGSLEISNNLFNPTLTFFSSRNVAINSNTDAGYKLDVVGVTRVNGTGSFNGQDAFVVRSSTQFIFRVNNDENIIIGRGGGTETYISAVNSGRLLIQNGVGANQTSTGGIQIGTVANYTQATGTQVFTIINPVFNPTGYSDANFSAFVIAPTINQSANLSTVGLSRGLYINPTLVSPKDFRAIETTSGNIIFNGGNLTVDTNTLFVDATNDRVGIGTTSPTYKLEASSAGYTAFGIMSGANNNAEIHFQNTGYGLPRWTIRTTGTPNGSSGNLTFQRLGSTFPLTITSGDNVLIGFGTDAGYKLDVNGTARIVNTLYVNTGNVSGEGIQLGSDSNRGIFNNSNAVQFRQYSGIFQFTSGNSGATTLFYTDGNGLTTSTNFGINIGGGYTASSILTLTSTTRGFLQPRMTNAQVLAITTPATGLQAYDTTNNKNLLYNGTTWQNIATESWIAGQGYITSQPWVVSGSDIYYNTGNVGIGTATPSYPFHISSAAAANIYGTVESTNANGTAAWVAFNDQSDNVVYRVFGSGASGTQMGIALARSASLMANIGGSGKFLLGTYSNTDFVMGTGNAEKMRIVDSTGNILIATTTDLGNKLEVSGSINATNYKVGNVAGWNGIINIPTMPPVMITVTNGIITNVM